MSNVGKFDPNYHHRQSIRLRGYDYSQSGLYFVTLCTYQRQCWFGEIKEGKMILNQIGKLVTREWLKSAEIRQEITLDYWIIMPNHLHGIVVIQQDHKDKTEKSLQTTEIFHQKPKSLSSFISGFKATVTRQVNQLLGYPNLPIWQRNYYESIIKDERHLNQVRQYIENNPQKWLDDPENPQNHHQFKDLLSEISF